MTILLWLLNPFEQTNHGIVLLEDSIIKPVGDLWTGFTGFSQMAPLCQFPVSLIPVRQRAELSLTERGQIQSYFIFNLS